MSIVKVALKGAKTLGGLLPDLFNVGKKTKVVTKVTSSLPDVISGNASSGIKHLTDTYTPKKVAELLCKNNNVSESSYEMVLETCKRMSPDDLYKLGITEERFQIRTKDRILAGIKSKEDFDVA